MTQRIAFLGGEVILENVGARRFGTIEELLAVGYSPEGTVNPIREVRLAGMDDRGSPFQLVLEFSGLEFGSLPSPNVPSLQSAPLPLSSRPSPVRPPHAGAEPSPIPSPAAPPTMPAIGAVGQPPTVAEAIAEGRIRLGDLLISLGLLTQDQLSRALEVQRQSSKKERLGIILQRLGFVTPKDLYQALSRQFRM